MQKNLNILPQKSLPTVHCLNRDTKGNTKKLQHNTKSFHLNLSISVCPVRKHEWLWISFTCFGAKESDNSCTGEATARQPQKRRMVLQVVATENCSFLVFCWVAWDISGCTGSPAPPVIIDVFDLRPSYECWTQVIIDLFSQMFSSDHYIDHRSLLIYSLTWCCLQMTSGQHSYDGLINTSCRRINQL